MKLVGWSIRFLHSVHHVEVQFLRQVAGFSNRLLLLFIELLSLIRGAQLERRFGRNQRPPFRKTLGY